MEPSFIMLTLALCVLSRGCSVFPLALLANVGRSPARKIRVHEQAVIWFSGLRGAIALALAVEFPTALDVAGTPGAGNFCYQREHVVACTIVVVMVTVFLLGGFTKPVLKLCGIEMSGGEGHGGGGEAPSTPVASPPAAAAAGAAPGTRGAAKVTSKHWIKRAVVAFDQRILRPVLVADYELAAPSGTASGDDAVANQERL